MSLEYPWLYQRAGITLADAEPVVEIVAVGDIMLGRSVNASEHTLEQAAPLLEEADLAVGNFEGVIAQVGQDARALSRTVPGQAYRLVAPSQAGALLHQAGIDLVSLANNHALDLKGGGLANTVENLQSAGLGVFGVNAGPADPVQPLFVELKGLRLAFIGFTMTPPPVRVSAGPTPARYEPAQAAAAVQSARQQADVVIVFMHWGYEYQIKADPAQEASAQALINAGADLVLGSHPHVVQNTKVVQGAFASSPNRVEPLPSQPDLSERREGFVAYSLGNFVFDQSFGDTQTGLALRVFLDRDGLRAVQAIPLQAGLHPRPLAAADGHALIARLQPPAQQLSFTCSPGACVAGEPVGTGQGGLFWSEKADLTGDGESETIYRRGGRAEIEQDGKIVWTSPVDWQVLDLAVGDPNNDGRSELLISLRKPDAQGLSRSHPFIVGYRRGMYKLLWGGSALSSPITEVEVGDIDGDGLQELLVLEEQAGGANALSVWRWHGWGFLLDWRSQPGWYENLSLANVPGRDQTAIILSQRWASAESQ